MKKITAILILGLAFRVCTAILLPVGDAPYKVAHLKYVLDIVQDWQILEVTLQRAHGGNHEIYQAPAFYFVGAFTAGLAGPETNVIAWWFRGLSIIIGLLIVIFSYALYPGGPVHNWRCHRICFPAHLHRHHRLDQK